VDKITIKIPATGSLVIDVAAYEGCSITGKWAADYFSDGKANNNLISNIYLFTENGTLVDSRAGYGTSDFLPGDGGIGLKHYVRSYRNPYLARNISPGTYVLAIGSYPLSQADAWAKSNSDGSSWTNYDVPRQIDLFNKYSVKVVFQLP